MKPINIKQVFLSLVLVYLSALSTYAQQSLWVGQSYTFDVSSSVMGITANMSWSTNGGYLSLSGSGFYRTITVTQYFSGTATVTCEWDYKLTGNDRYTHTKRQVSISCRDNQVSITPTALSMSPGETTYVNYHHQYDNQYTSFANAYFQSTNPSVVSVNQHTGEVTALKSGSAYINVYSKISSKTPYCIVEVEQIDPISISLPNTLEIVNGETKTLKPTLNPSNATTHLFWTSNNTSVATVSQEGEVRGVHYGSAVITVKTENGLSAQCNVDVQKPTLKLYSSCESGLHEYGSHLRLYTDVSNSEIYYTTNGSTPTRNSVKYTGPIMLNETMVIKAIAYHNDYLESAIKRIDIGITHLSTLSSYPLNNTEDVFPDIIPYLEFNTSIAEGVNYNNILFESQDAVFSFETYIDGSRLYLVSNESLKVGTYKIIIPEGAVINSKDKEQNIKKELYFAVEGRQEGLDIASGDTSYYIDFDKNLWGFGRTGGALDVDRTGAVLNPRLILTDIEKIVNGLDHTAAIDSNGNLWMWGSNYNGQLGDGKTIDTNIPTKVLSNVKSIECINGTTTFAIKTDNTLWGWGYNDEHEIYQKVEENVLTPVKILVDNIKQVSHDYYHTFAVDMDETLWAWGYNVHGFLGTGDKKSRAYPTRIMTEVSKVVANGSATFIIKSDNSLWVCGSNEFGQLGLGETPEVLSPKKLMDNVTDIISSAASTFCLKTDGSLWAWGYNMFGQLGTGSFSPVKIPTKIAENVRMVTSQYSTAILKNDGTVWVCGKNENGELCNGQNSNVNELIELKFPSKVTDVSFFAYRGMALTDDGKVWSWGCGPRGDGTNNDICSPIIIYPKYIPSIKTIEIDRSEISIIEGQELPLAVNVVPINSEFNMNWMTLNPAVATVSSRGVVKAETEGITEIKLDVTDSSGTPFSRKCKIFVDKESAGVHDISDDCTKIIYSNGSLNVYNVKPNTGIKLYNLEGMLITEILEHGNYISVPIISKGIYIAKIGVSETYKFVAK